MQQRSVALTSFVVPGIVAGLIGGVTLDLYRLTTIVFLLHAESVVAFYQFVASGLIGKAAYASPATAVLGVAVHFVVSAGWGAGYAYAAQRTPQIRSRPIISGIVFGLIVQGAMVGIQIAADIFSPPTPSALINEAIAHAFFFGVPIGLYVSRRAVAA